MNITAKRLQNNFGRAAADYDAHAWLQRQQVERVLLSARQYFPNNAAILDVGCGTGYFAELAKSEHPDWRITGLDYAYGMTAHARTRCDAVLQADATHLPIADAALDGLVSSLCLQWISDQPQMLREMGRTLKPGATAILTTLGDRTLGELHAASAQSGVALGLLPMHSFAHYRALAMESGMQLVACQRTMATQHYPNVEALLESMRVIGAGNAGGKQFVGPKAFARLIQQYEASFGTARGIPATWEPILMILKRV